MLPNNLYRAGFDAPTPEPPRNEQVEVLRKWVDGNCLKSRDINEDIDKSSYSLKHMAERDLGRYVAMGDFIAAMILEGYQFKRVEDSLNCFFNVDI